MTNSLQKCIWQIAKKLVLAKDYGQHSNQGSILISAEFPI